MRQGIDLFPVCRCGTSIPLFIIDVEEVWGWIERWIGGGGSSKGKEGRGGGIEGEEGD